MNVMTAPRYLLANHAFAALVDDVFVFLDLKTDQYSALEAHHTVAFARMTGLSEAVPEHLREPSLSRDEIAELTGDLERRGLITLDPEAGRPAQLLPEPATLRELYAYGIDEAPVIRAIHVWRFLSAWLAARAQLRFRPIGKVVARVAARRGKHEARAERDPARIAEVLEIFRTLKPLVVTVKDQCLPNGLFLLEFLARHRIYPSWYFGVRLKPFYAHCWVQEGDVVYDDFVQDVCQNRPILRA